MDGTGQPSPPAEGRGEVPVSLPPPPAAARTACPPTCATPPEPAVARRRFRAIVVPALVLSAFAWVALVLWGGGREMRRGLLTGGAPLMSDGSMAAGMDMAGMNMSGADVSGAGMAGGAMPGMDMPGREAAGHSMAMLGFDMSGLQVAGLAYAGLFVWMWTVMVVAMMLPATLPSVRVFLAGDRTRRPGAGVAFLLGCLVTWAVAGLAVYGVFVVLDLALPEPGAESRFALGVGAAGLLAAGLFQFSRSKQRLLCHVRGPFDCGTGTVRAGLHHGRRCLASCGPYMLSVALIGMMSVFWMAVFAVVMTLEQILEMLNGKGMLVARAAGAVTVLVAIGLLLTPTPLPLVG